MTNYHVVWKILESDFFSTGKTYEAYDPESAIGLWREENPGTIFFAIYITGQ